MQNESNIMPGQRLGRLPLKTTRKALQFSDFFKYLNLPARTDFWTKKRPLPLRSFGNTTFGSCTRSKQAVMQQRFERLEQGRTIPITDEEIVRVYLEMTSRLYGGGDTGAYEDDALNEWRRPETTFKDTKGHAYTIDAYLRINASNQDELKAAIALSGAHGIAICVNLPAAWANVNPPDAWALPANQPLVGEYMPGSWGGHSMCASDYTERGMILDDTWEFPRRLITWSAVAAYVDEAHLVMDSANSWRKKVLPRAASSVAFDIQRVIDAVNDVSTYRILNA